MAAIDPERVRTSRQLAEQLALLFDNDPEGSGRPPMPAWARRWPSR
ncbi:hypothetical protein ACWDTT_17480 [Streptosporangium sandarakinum]